MARTQIGTANVENGAATTEYVIPGDTAAGSYTLYATYGETDNYMLGTGYNTVEIRIPTTTTVENVMTSYGETATFTAHVTHHTNQNVTGGSVQFQVAGVNVGTPAGVNDGEATLQTEVLQSWNDDDEITALFLEDNTYGASSATAQLNIRADCNVEVTSLSANRGETATITAAITDSNGDNVPSGEAELYIDNTIQGEAQTVSNGEVSFSYPVASNAAVGGHSIKVVYLQNDTLELNTAEGTGQLTVRTPVTLTPVNVSANVGDEAPIYIDVADENSTPVTQGTVMITVGNGTPQEAELGNGGRAAVQYTVPEGTAGSVINFTAQYVENDNYQGASTTVAGELTVRLGTTITVDSVKAELGDTITLGATVVDQNGQNVNEGTVTYELE